MTQQIVKTKKMLKRLAELLALGLSESEIANILNKEFNQDLSRDVVKTMIKRQAIFKKQIIATDKEFKQIHKEMLLELLAKAKKNMEILENLRGNLITRFNEIKVDMPDSKLMSFNKEINISIRTFNDTIRSINELLKRMETETTEVTLSQVQEIQETVKILKDLEDAGYIKINEDFYKSDLYKEMQEEDK